MKPCPHKHVEARIWSRRFKDWRPWTPGGSFVADALVCRDCKAWLAVGESDETQSEVEIRAAALVIGDGRTVGCERCGWCNHQSGTFTPPYDHCDRDDFDAGYLARQIETHDEQNHGIATHEEQT